MSKRAHPPKPASRAAAQAARQALIDRTAPLLEQAIAQVRGGHYETAMEALQALIALDAKHEIAIGMLGSVQAELNAPEQAVACFQRVLEINPGNTLARIQLGEQLAALQRPREALAAWAPCLPQPGEFLAHYLSGLALMKLDEVEEARFLFAKAARFMPPDHEHRAALEQMLRVLG